jgi:ABC-type iron transport system FetAB ATPase subunit
VQLWVSHDDAQIERFGGRVLQLPHGHVGHSTTVKQLS